MTALKRIDVPYRLPGPISIEEEDFFAWVQDARTVGDLGNPGPVIMNLGMLRESNAFEPLLASALLWLLVGIAEDGLRSITDLGFFADMILYAVKSVFGLGLHEYESISTLAVASFQIMAMAPEEADTLFLCNWVEIVETLFEACSDRLKMTSYNWQTDTVHWY